ncbi:MAG: ChbG/HpnK family deacetylase [Bacteroidales bacterium]|nr:ChbG/HpnK family deacetylase [Bacteroidales bacterium]
MNIIINADDFGLTCELNHCIQDLYNKGIVLSTTLIANSQFFDQAVSIAKKSPGLGVGVHLCLDGPFNISHEQSSIVNPENGQFYDNITAIKKLRRFEFCPNDIFNEYDRQIQKVLDNGIKITHIDHHHHFHLYYQSLRQIIKLSGKYGIKSIRSQKILVPVNHQPLNNAYRLIHQAFVKRYLKVPDGYFVLLPSRNNRFDFNLKRLEHLLTCDYKYVEIECHPNSSNDFDTQFLNDPSFIELIKTHTLTNYSSF